MQATFAFLYIPQRILHPASPHRHHPLLLLLLLLRTNNRAKYTHATLQAARQRWWLALDPAARLQSARHMATHHLTHTLICYCIASCCLKDQSRASVSDLATRRSPRCGNRSSLLNNALEAAAVQAFTRSPPSSPTHSPLYKLLHFQPRSKPLR